MSNQEPAKDDQPVDSEIDAEELARNDEIAQEAADLSDLGGVDLEAAYLKAMSVLEASDWQMREDMTEPAQSQPVTNSHNSSLSDTAASKTRESLSMPRAVTDQSPAATDSEPESIAVRSDADVVNIEPAETRVIPRQIIEACLFVGGTALTASKLSGILRGEFNNDFVDREIDELNRQYAAQGRPYEIRFGEGGYRMALRDEFERIRHKVYGLGPKEVRLSQEALEVLAVVAYHQPIKQAQVEGLGKPGCGGVLRQLVRRELLAVERDPEHPRDVNYKTTPRFLSLFGIRSLDELPRHEQVSYK